LPGDGEGNGIPILLTLPRPDWLLGSCDDIGDGTGADEGGTLLDQEGWLLPFVKKMNSG